MYAFKESGKYYSEEKVTFPAMPHYELLDRLEDGQLKTSFTGMTRVFVPITSENNEIPFLLPAK